jgi:PPM family protein phosphatase
MVYFLTFHSPSNTLGSTQVEIQEEFMPSPSAGVVLDAHVVSECGPVRHENQDVGAAWRGQDGSLALVVSDGMGGHEAGREAAEIVVRECLTALNERAVGEPWHEVLRRGIDAAQAAMRRALCDAPPNVAMGATAALAVIDGTGAGPRLHVAHVGDSRVYLYRGRSLYRLTADHSLVAQMVRDGLLDEDQAFSHPDRNVIQRAVGQEGLLEPELQEPVTLEEGDLVLVSSDGLHGAVPEPALAAEIANGGETAEAVCRALLTAALAAGGEDNVTVGCARLARERRERRPTRVQDQGRIDPCSSVPTAAL